MGHVAVVGRALKRVHTNGSFHRTLPARGPAVRGDHEGPRCRSGVPSGEGDTREQRPAAGGHRRHTAQAAARGQPERPPGRAAAPQDGGRADEDRLPEVRVRPQPDRAAEDQEVVEPAVQPGHRRARLQAHPEDGLWRAPLEQVQITTHPHGRHPVRAAALHEQGGERYIQRPVRDAQTQNRRLHWPDAGEHREGPSQQLRHPQRAGPVRLPYLAVPGNPYRGSPGQQDDARLPEQRQLRVLLQDAQDHVRPDEADAVGRRDHEGGVPGRNGAEGLPEQHRGGGAGALHHRVPGDVPARGGLRQPAGDGRRAGGRPVL